MHRVLCKRNSAPFPASLAFRFGFALPYRLNFARNPKNGRKQSPRPVSRSIPSQSPPPASSRSHLWRRELLSLREAIPFWFANSSLVNRINSRICWSLVCDVAHELAMSAKKYATRKKHKEIAVYLLLVRGPPVVPVSRFLTSSTIAGRIRLAPMLSAPRAKPVSASLFFVFRPLSAPT
jgi:hypothetical protein